VILTVTLNAAVDTTYRVDTFGLHGTNRVLDVQHRAGGKGVNVARVLHALGHDTTVTGFAGGRAGDDIRADLVAAGIRDELLPIAGESRRTVTVVDCDDATVLNEPGPAICAPEWAALLARIHTLAAQAAVVVLAGSVPRGLPDNAYALLAGAAGDSSVVLDTSGKHLMAALGTRPAVVKPNHAELADIAPGRDVLDAAQALRGAGAGAVVVSMGAGGAIAVTGEGRFRAAPPETVSGNPTGAGDAAVASLAAGIANGASWPDRLGDAVALSAAAVLHPVAGSFDRDAYARFRGAVTVEEL
jgi:tagatose 6-phosphate kinase